MTVDHLTWSTSGAGQVPATSLELAAGSLPLHLPVGNFQRSRGIIPTLAQ
jgi:hypothetical protein